MFPRVSHVTWLLIASEKQSRVERASRHYKINKLKLPSEAGSKL